ncbi:MAG: class I SAM-dependent methyltransferase [Rhizobiaceae bacterium]|nr:class I SAM-dependent methyltransferase [Rhizobiaceae bacterium]
MSQRTAGIYRLTQVSSLYSAFQRALGGDRTLRLLVDELIRPQPGSHILDLGCGPASIRPALGNVVYVGIDLNPDHIARAQTVVAPSDRLHMGDFASLTGELGGSFDQVLCVGLLHHLDDDRCIELARLARTYLKPGGRFLAIDPVFEERQNPIAWLLAKLDSGEHVRYAAGYQRVIENGFPGVETVVRRDLLKVPYSHCITTAVTEAARDM